MPEYIFTKPGITKLFVLDQQLREICPVIDYCSYDDPTLVVVTFSEISLETLTLLQNQISQYVDPEVYLQLKSTDSNTAASRSTNSSTLTSVLVWIMLGSTQTSSLGVFNAVKTVLTIKVDDIAQLVGNSQATVSIVLHSITRDVALVTETINLDQKLLEWSDQAANQNQSGSRVHHQSVMFEGLRNTTCDYDNICEWQLAVTNPAVKVSLNGLQSLYYQLL